MQLLEHILENAEDFDNVDEPSCSYDTSKCGQKRKQETDHPKQTKKTKVSYHICTYALICNKHLFHKHMRFAFLQM